MTTIGAFLRRDAQVAVSYRVPFVLEALSALFVMLTFSLLARLVESGRVPGGYFSFAATGVALTAFLQAGLSVVSANFRQEQVQGTLEALLSTGASTGGLAAGMAAYPVAFALARAAIYALVAAALGARVADANWGLAVGATMLGAVAFAGLGLVASALVLTIRQAAGAIGFLVSLLGLAGGALFPLDLLPRWARILGEVSPFTHALRLTRRALLEGSTWADGAGSLAILASVSLAYAALGMGALRMAIAWSRRRGGLGEY